MVHVRHEVRPALPLSFLSFEPSLTLDDGGALPLLARSVIHFFFSWFSAPGFLPDPFFRIFLKNGHRTKHGSDTGVYDSEGRFIPAKFEEIFSKCVSVVRQACSRSSREAS